MTPPNGSFFKKRVVIIALAAAGGAGAGWIYATVLAACGGTCAVGAHPLIVTFGLAAVATYSAIVATRQQV